MNDNKQYQASDIRIVSFPPWLAGGDGRMVRTWRLELSQPPGRDPRELRVEDAALEVGIELVSPEDSTNLVVRTTAVGEPMSDETFYWATYRVFRVIDRDLGPIAMIQGHPRSAWLPFWHDEAG